MNSANTRNTIRPSIMAIEYGCASLGLNVVAKRLEKDVDDRLILANHMRDMGHSKLINLTHRFNEGRVVMPFYAGDGIVTKIIPADYFDETEPVLAMPCITSDEIRTENHKYLINTYPWVPPALEGRDIVEDLRAIITPIGMDYTDGDAHPRNVHALPDGLHTPVGIDSYMYVIGNHAMAVSGELKEAWYDYLEALYPVYANGTVPKQSEETNFDFISIHDQDAGLRTFDPQQANPIIMNDQETAPRKKGFGGFFGFGGSQGLDPA